jgi:hypothetical protein
MKNFICSTEDRVKTKAKLSITNTNSIKAETEMENKSLTIISCASLFMHSPADCVFQ